jgi:hypothetical protein
MEPELPPRNPDEIARQIDADLAAQEAKELLQLHRQLRLGVVEILILAGLFAFGIGMVATVIMSLPQENEALYRFKLLWILGFLGSVVLALNFLIGKFRVMRRLLIIQERRLTRLEQR